MNTTVKDYIIHELLNGREVGDTEELLLSDLVDSLGVMRLVAFLEKAFGIRIPHQDITIENFASIELIHGYLARHTGS